ncbi:hypothetical protein KPL70_001425 [Citrus sinensis]|nr:hypothetical protein KPL70_001425 [Citrus sinensis]
MGGVKYMVIFIDDYSRICWVYPIKKKSDVFSVFKEYKARVELESDKKIKCLRTDNSGVYRRRVSYFLKDEDNSTAKEKSETVPVYVENNLEDSDSSEAAPEHEKQEPVESKAPEVHRSTREKRPPTSDIALWMTAIYEEIEALHKNKTWELVPLPHGRKVIGNKWVYKIKRNGNDQVERYRARLVVKGYAQKEGIDFNEIFSPVVRITTIREVLAMCATFDLYPEQLDVKIAFLHREFEEEIYMLQPEAFTERGNENLVCRLNKSLYGLKQASREFEMKDLGPVNKIVGMQIHRDRNNKKIWLSQKNYLKKILRRFNIQDCTSIFTLLPVNFKLSSSMCHSNETERNEMPRVPYASAVGSLMFAMICTRPDIAQVVEAVSRYMANPGGEHWIAMKRILRYIKGTSDVALCYRGSEFTIRDYVDSYYAGNLDKRKSTTSYVFTLVGAAVSWVSKLQTVVALSTTETEYMAATQACKKAIWIQSYWRSSGTNHKKFLCFVTVRVPCIL